MTLDPSWEPDPLGDAPCPRCGLVIFWAWDDSEVPTPLEPDEHGGWVVAEDVNRIPWVRADDGGQLALDERLYRRHEPSCSPVLAPVIPLQSRRRPESARRYA
jgi:hypothetical protein